MEALTNTNAAEVSPSMRCLDCKIVPAPIKPIPDTTWAAIRVGSPSEAINEKWVNKQDPMQMRVCVLIPAGFPMDSRSMPMANPHPMDKMILKIKISHSSSLKKNSMGLLYQK